MILNYNDIQIINKTLPLSKFYRISYHHQSDGYHTCKIECVRLCRLHVLKHCILDTLSLTVHFVHTSVFSVPKVPTRTSNDIPSHQSYCQISCFFKNLIPFIIVDNKDLLIICLPLANIFMLLFFFLFLSSSFFFTKASFSSFNAFCFAESAHIQMAPFCLRLIFPIFCLFFY